MGNVTININVGGQEPQHKTRALSGSLVATAPGRECKDKVPTAEQLVRLLKIDF